MIVSILGLRRGVSCQIKFHEPESTLTWHGESYLLRGDGLLAGLSELLDGLLVVSQILLAADEDDGETLAEVQNLGDPL